MNHSLCAVAALVLSFSVVAQGNPEGVAERTVIYELGRALRPLPGIQQKFDEPGHLVLPAGWVLPPDYYEGGLDLDSGTVVTQLVPIPWLYLDDVLEYLDPAIGELAVEPMADRFALRAAPAVHQEVRKRLASLVTLARQEVVVEVYRLVGVPDRALLDAAAVIELRAKGEILMRGSQFLDVPALTASGEAIAYLRDYDVEVASDSTIGDPKVDTFFAGLRLGLTATPLIDGRLYLRMGLAHSAVVTPVPARQYGTKGMGLLHVPAIEVDEVRTAAVIVDGGGVVVGGGNGTYLLTMSRVEGRAKLPEEAVPLGVAAVLPLPVEKPRVAAHRPGRDGFALDAEEDMVPELDLFMDLVSNGALSESEEPMQKLGTYALIAEAELRGSIEQAVRAQTAELQTRTIHWACGSVAAADVPALGVAVASSLVAGLSASGVIAAVPGQPFQGALGAERSYVGDYEVEIASDASMGNPVVRATFEGLAFNGALDRGLDQAPGGDIYLTSRWSYSVPSIAEPTQIGTKHLGGIDLPRIAVFDSSGSQRLTPGQWSVLNVHPDPRQKGRVIVIAAKVE